MFLRACLHKSGGHEVGEVSLIGVVTCLPICSLILLWSRLHDRWADPPHVTSPILGPPPPCKPALIFPKAIEPVQMMCWPPQSVLHMVGHELNNFIGTKESFYIGNRITPTGLVANINMAAAFHCFETPILADVSCKKALYVYVYISGMSRGRARGLVYYACAWGWILRLRSSFARARQTTSYAGYSSPGLRGFVFLRDHVRECMRVG